MQRLVLFDLDNTLVDRAVGLRSWAEEFCRRHGLNGEAAAWIVEADGDGLAPKESFFSELRRRYRLHDSVEQLWADYRRRHPTLIPASPCALDGLDQLREAGWKIGVVTNGLTDQQQATLTCTRVAEHVDAWAISSAEGTAKPQRRLFEIAAGRCGMSLHDGGWMVGDSAQADIAGGHATGLTTVWIDRGRSWPLTDLRPEHTAAGISEAIALLLD